MPKTIDAIPPESGGASGFSGAMSAPGLNDMKTALILVVIAFAWGLNYVVVKNVYAGITPLSYCASRFVAAGVILLLITRFTEGKAFVEKSDIFGIAALAVFGFGFSNLFMALALKNTGASTASMISSTAPIFAIFSAALFKIDNFSLKKTLAIMISIFGIYFIVSGRGVSGSSVSNDASMGVVYCFISAITWAIYSVFSKRLLKKYSAVRFTANVVFISSLAMIPVAYNELSATGWLSLPGFVYYSFIFSVFFSSVIPLIYWNRCIARTGPVTVMMSQNMVPVFALICAYFFLHEAVSSSQLMGSFVVICSILLGTL
ncbi:MAG TPA: DMT family transporter [Candidatus Wallbacteria bacterium]|nr:DMT family transporter [Candidatus Wallbacteria bacterium]